ncbi:hypothetical protein O181_061430 [Austropuccinia psidii MF-1]|uniref:Uncharacterized protein n=1 Tax=Austropuccinia psidii MF-1 TaxID=1389203 RepID=A0A9Q3EF61_9BASI|nr:hypothetical protein [Austropuccinia psidii MF-1]
MHPFDAPFSRPLPNYRTDAGVRANNDWPRLFMAPAHCQAATRFHMHPPTGHMQAAFTCLADLYRQSSDRLFAWSGGHLDC